MDELTRFAAILDLGVVKHGGVYLKYLGILERQGKVSLTNDIKRSVSERAELISQLQRLWGSDPGSYWPALRQSGLTAQDVWPQQAVTFAGKELVKPKK